MWKLFIRSQAPVPEPILRAESKSATADAWHLQGQRQSISPTRCSAKHVPGGMRATIQSDSRGQPMLDAAEGKYFRFLARVPDTSYRVSVGRQLVYHQRVMPFRFSAASGSPILSTTAFSQTLVLANYGNTATLNTLPRYLAIGKVTPSTCRIWRNSVVSGTNAYSSKRTRTSSSKPPTRDPRAKSRRRAHYMKQCKFRSLRWPISRITSGIWTVTLCQI